MSIDSLAAINPLLPTATELPALQPIGVGNHTSFGEMLISGAMKADANLKIADQAMQAFALGGDIPPHQVMLALEEARMSLHFALQVRSRLIEGYQELMRMQL